MEIQPSKEQIEKWIKNYVPKKDYFFLGEKDLQTFEKYFNYVLIIPRGEFFQHPSYSQIQLVNSFEYWNLSKEALYVLVASSDWFTSLPANLKKVLNEIQFKMGRGLILPVPDSISPNSVPEDYLVEEKHFVLQSEMWRKLPFDIKESFIINYASQWDNWTGIKTPEHTPLHLKKYANTFPTESGSNCLAATLFAISEQEWMVNEWVHPQTFKQGLMNRHYHKTEYDELVAGDVVTWENADGIIQHAAYHISDHLFFNKNGQTFFNPWKIVAWDDLKEEWKEYDYIIYRKK
ncbi:hypothetical protein [Pseudoneobacillus sp. C159]